MSIKRIEVKGLFGEFDHEVPVNREERITIVYGPNGFGKTYLLRLVNALFNSDFEVLASIPFEKMSVLLDGEGTLDVSSSAGEISISYNAAGKKTVAFSPKSSTPVPIWFTEIVKNTSVYFVNTDRLMNTLRGKGVEVTVASLCSSEIKTSIQAKIAEFADVSHSIDSSFPLRLVKRNTSKYLCNSELKEKIEKLESNKSRLIKSGLLEKGEMNISELGDLSETDCAVLTLYIEDAEKKLAVFEPFASRLQLLLDILNSRFLNKRVTVSRQDGFIFHMTSGKILQPENLSSGEQHMLVLLYELLFNMEPGSLVLIDEPELSLHIYWQQQFLKDIEQIIKLSGFDVLIATHSPQIIHDRWDLAVELKGPIS